MDWYVLLTPILLLPIVSLLVFVGCSLEDEGTFEGVPVKIHYNGANYPVTGYATKLGFWCVYNDDDNQKRAPINNDWNVTDFSSPNKSIELMLTGGFIKTVKNYCNCYCNVYTPGNPDPKEIFSGIVEFGVYSTIDFEFKVWPPTDNLSTGFGIELKDISP